jgi:hypothetical protein
VDQIQLALRHISNTTYLEGWVDGSGRPGGAVGPVHTAIAAVISPWVIDKIDKRRLAFLWKGKASISGGPLQAGVTKSVQTARTRRFGFSKFGTNEYALRLRWLWSRRTEPHKAWSLLPEKRRKWCSRCFTTLHR